MICLRRWRGNLISGLSVPKIHHFFHSTRLIFRWDLDIISFAESDE